VLCQLPQVTSTSQLAQCRRAAGSFVSHTTWTSKPPWELNKRGFIFSNNTIYLRYRRILLSDWAHILSVTKVNFYMENSPLNWLNFCLDYLFVHLSIKYYGGLYFFFRKREARILKILLCYWGRRALSWASALGSEVQELHDILVSVLSHTFKKEKQGLSMLILW
jgi:hypothetical protein